MSFIRDDDTGLVLIKPDWPDCPANVRAYSSTRIGGVSVAPYGDVDGDNGLNLANHVGDDVNAVRMNRDCISDFFPKDVTFLSQIHGILAVDAANIQDGQIVEADACYTKLSKVPCAILTADCLPILLASTDGRCVAAVHAGWRGLAAGVVEAAVLQMRKNSGHEITAWLGPAIGASAFEVGADVVNAFTQKMPQQKVHFKPLDRDAKFLADMYGLARTILQGVGINSISGGEHCTFTEDALFYSYRRDGVTGRMASWIWFE
ncbi:peptidoglycan editing factor PgeF [Undibacterium flavidum]|uniref:Purine nucleoside phosphorylase n=1 Tax=Undibacterium flavidum TaxID=2762297 RepID=A0ABR6YFP4_9BURK|nr:peptidoglycan editing factor PgeF [Undibacterium flavidum]MBC3875362.1 peptidoglycan editing factor PgeF [Undibacterium flavidum]